MLFLALFQLISQQRLDEKKIFTRGINDPNNKPERRAMAAKRRPGDGGVQSQVGKFVHDLIEPLAKGRAGSLQPGKASVGGVQNERRRQRQRDDRTTEPVRQDPAATNIAAPTIKTPEAIVTALGRIDVGQSRSASCFARGNAQYLPNG